MLKSTIIETKLKQIVVINKHSNQVNLCLLFFTHHALSLSNKDADSEKNTFARGRLVFNQFHLTCALIAMLIKSSNMNNSYSAHSCCKILCDYQIKT